MATYPADHVVVEIAPGGAPLDPGSWVWVDVTDLCYKPIVIDYGRRDEQSQAGPTKCTLTVNNDDGRFSPRNPLGPWFGRIGLNTPLRVRWDDEVRFVGFVSEWPTRWLGLVDNSRVPVVANGITRRLGQGIETLRSALFRQISSGDPVQYWPLEDGSDSTAGASAVSGGRSLRPFGDVSFGASGGPVGGSAQVALNTGSLSGALRLPQTDAPFTFGMWVSLDSGEWVQADMRTNRTGGPFGAPLDLRLIATPSVLTLALATVESATTIASHSADLTGVHHVAVSMDGDDFTLYVDGVSVATGTSTSAPLSVSQILLRGFGAAGGGVSHVAAWPLGAAAMGPVLADQYQAGLGYLGESAIDRVTRICVEENVPLAPIDAAASMAMGPQPTGSFLGILRDCETTDGGVLYELDASLAYQPRAARYNQPVALALDWSDLHGAPQPTDDDQNIRNEVTVGRPSGSSAVAADDESAEGYPGRYPDSVTVNTSGDEVLDDIAGWRLHLGTVDEDRWPSISVDMADRDHLIPAWLAFRLGSRVTVAHEFPQLPGVAIDLLAEGWRETLHSHRWLVELMCVPASPWKVFKLDDDILGRVDQGSSTLAAAVDADDMSLSVAFTGNRWTTDAADLPFEVEVGGEVMTVTGISGTSSPQTFTMSRGANGITKPHSAGASLHLCCRPVVAL